MKILEKFGFLVLTVLFSFSSFGQQEKQIPLFYSSQYNISFWGLERVHPFDAAKYGKVVNQLKKYYGLRDSQFAAPEKMVIDKDLELVHTENYLNSLKNTLNVLDVAEMVPEQSFLFGFPRWVMSFIPNRFLQQKLLDPMRWATAGTVDAARIALKNKRAAINIGGGFHHAKKNDLEKTSFCYFGDIQFAIEKLWKEKEGLKVLIVDLDAHQGNGHESYFLKKEATAGKKNAEFDERITIFDVYNKDLPEHREDKLMGKYNFPISSGMKTDEYLKIVEENLPKAIKQANPGLIIYNAGTDILSGDPEGQLDVSKVGIIQRDEFIFKEAKEKNIPVVMLTSGGYTSASAGVIADSIKNLAEKKYIPVLEEYLPRSIAEYL